ncbi:MAG: TetR/AcrR family transcriptional regulator [Filimonas sp.]|nr:TetR/AcrR family transcriptional regulator [Filimonas sp.]
MKPKVKDISAEEKIKEAARKIFTKKGYAATRTRDIAEEAGLNLALLNYYFRSKEKLFEIVMMENFLQFVAGIRVIVYDEETSLDDKIEKIVSHYIDQLLNNPDLPLFVLNEMHNNPKIIKANISKDIFFKSAFMKQLIEALKKNGKQKINPVHFIMNTFSMTIFPFVASPIIIGLGVLKEQEFKAEMEVRRKQIPLWIKAMIISK